MNILSSYGKTLDVSKFSIKVCCSRFASEFCLYKALRRQKKYDQFLALAIIPKYDDIFPRTIIPNPTVSDHFMKKVPATVSLWCDPSILIKQKVNLPRFYNPSANWLWLLKYLTMVWNENLLCLLLIYNQELQIG